MGPFEQFDEYILEGDFSNPSDNFDKYILYTHGPAPRVERRWRVVGRRGSKRGVGRCGGRDGGRSRSAEFERFQWRKFQQFQ